MCYGSNLDVVEMGPNGPMIGGPNGMVVVIGMVTLGASGGS